jgi:thioester reductase-like protein
MEHAQRRVRASLEMVGVPAGKQTVQVLLGDITQPRLGLDDIASLQNVSCIFHCAARMEFRDEQAQANERVNVFGTEQVLRLAEELKVPVCHFSTAYIAGRSNQIAFENQIDRGQEFHNSYEATKCRAELKVQEWTQRTGLPAYVFRPGVVVGDSETGSIRHFDGMYNLLRFFDNIAGLIGLQKFRAIASPNATKNLVPVDYVALAAWEIFQSGRPGTFHLTHPEPIRLDDLRAIFGELMHIPGVRLVSEDAFRERKPTKYELLYQRTANYYQPYLRDEPKFDRSNTHAVLGRGKFSAAVPRLDRLFFVRLLDYARRRQWGKLPIEEESKQSSLDRNVMVYFDDFLAGKLHQSLLPELRRLTASCRVVIDERDDLGWGLRICKGQLEEISRNGIDCACTFYVDHGSFRDIVSGRQSPQQAFFDKKIEIRGNMETGLKLATVLAAFFRRYPYHADRRDA